MDYEWPLNVTAIHFLGDKDVQWKQLMIVAQFCILNTPGVHLKIVNFIL